MQSTCLRLKTHSEQMSGWLQLWVVDTALAKCNFRSGGLPGLGEGPALVLLRLGRVGILVGAQTCVDGTEEGSVGGGSQAGGVGVPGTTARGVPAGTSTLTWSSVTIFLVFPILFVSCVMALHPLQPKAG